jgi:hypothetical protein
MRIDPTRTWATVKPDREAKTDPSHKPRPVSLGGDS